jgi:anaerobic magnesium-protoporphyrin IX monomethyl ester cyclase
LPQPAWDLVDIETYRRAWTSAHGYFSLNMVSSRGCPYRCNWCAKPIYGQHYHCRAARSVAVEMLHLKTAFAPDHIWFADDIFALSPKWTRQFAEAVESLGAQVPFKMQSRCDLMTDHTVETLRRAGCAEVWMGAESGSQRILDAMDKGTRLKDIYRAVEHLRGEGIRACLFLQFGYPGETWNEIEETIRMVRETRPDDIGVSVSYPLPGTRFYTQVSEQLGQKSNWSDSGDLAMIFRGAYSSEFYRALAEAMHTEVRGYAVDNQSAWMRVRELERTSRIQPDRTHFPILRESAEFVS